VPRYSRKAFISIIGHQNAPRLEDQADRSSRKNPASSFQSQRLATLNLCGRRLVPDDAFDQSLGASDPDLFNPDAIASDEANASSYYARKR
jgi:hypothetical protein